MIINFVSFVVPPAHIDAFLRLCVLNAETSLREEPGVITFDVLIKEDSTDTIILQEAYRDRAAYESHRTTPHFLAFVQGVKACGAERTAIVAKRFYPAASVSG